MLFTVTYRGKDGSLVEETIDAVDRAKCMVECRAREITPVRIIEKAKDAPTRMHSYRRPAMRLPRSMIILGLLTILPLAIIVIVWWYEKGDQNDIQNKDESALRMSEDVTESDTTVHKPSDDISDEVSEKQSPTNSTDTAIKVTVPVTKAPPTAPVEEVLSVTTNKSGYIVERVRNPDGTTRRRVRTPPPIFKHGSDQMIAMVLSAPPGQAIPPMPANAVSDKEFLDSLKEEIEILDTDSDEVKNMKANVIVARNEIKAMMAKGYSAQQVLQEHLDLSNDNAKLRTDALLELKSILESGDRDGARRYAVSMNAAFQQMGVMEIPVPSKDGKAEVDAQAERVNNLKERAKQSKEHLK